MIERVIEMQGPDKGRVIDVAVAEDLADAMDAWRDEGNGRMMLSPPERLGKPEIHFRDLVNTELKRLILAKAEVEIDTLIDDPAAKEKDPETRDEKWMTYRMANKLDSIGEEHGFDLQTCSDLLEMSFPEAFEVAYSYLIQAGLDADSILAEFMES
jgi:hypothetical protein